MLTLAETLEMPRLLGPRSHGQIRFQPGAYEELPWVSSAKRQETSVKSELKSLDPDMSSMHVIQSVLGCRIGEREKRVGPHTHQLSQARVCRIPSAFQPYQSLLRERGPAFAFQERTHWGRKVSPAIMVKRGDRKSPVPSQHASPLELEGKRVFMSSGPSSRLYTF